MFDCVTKIFVTLTYRNLTAHISSIKKTKLQKSIITFVLCHTAMVKDRSYPFVQPFVNYIIPEAATHSKFGSSRDHANFHNLVPTVSHLTAP